MRAMSLPQAFLCLFFTASTAAYAQQTPPPGTFSIASVDAGGNGCPAGSVAANLSSDNQAFTLLFDQYIVNSQSAYDQKGCNLNLIMRVPLGWSFALLSVDYRGYANVAAGSTAKQYSSYSYSGHGGILPEQALTGPLSNDYFNRVMVPVSSYIWTPCNLPTITLQIATSLDIRGTGMVSVDSIDGEVKHQYAVAWQRCHPSPAAPIVPVYRKFKAGDHFLTRMAQEAPGYKLEGVAFYLYDRPFAPNMTALYRCITRGKSQDHFTSAAANCEGSLVEGVLGYMFTSAEPGLVPIYRIVKVSKAPNPDMDHLSTTVPSEGANLGYKLEGAQGFVLLSP